MILHKILFVIWLHFLGDFILQSDWMATQKWHNGNALALHALTYSIPLFLIGWKYALVNAGWHGVVDAVTSRITHKLWVEEKRHWFFVVIGLDQAIHMTFLMVLLLGQPS